jgi:4-diphosphocytidyl-2-C-methyl-D-erythritol kinase
MEALTEGAFAKLNLTLDVLKKRDDGYHELKMICQTISLHDDVIVNLGTGTDWAVHCYREQEDGKLCTEDYPQDGDNLAWKAAKLYFDRIGQDPGGLEIFISKRIPAQAGLAGGSADAAAVLRALNRHYKQPLSIPALCELGFQAGSDVPFCVMGGCALVEGRGELLTKLPEAPEMFFVVCMPDFQVSTPELFAEIDSKAIAVRPDHKAMMSNLLKGELLGVGGCLCNVFEPLVMAKHFEINYIKSMMFTYGAYGAQMTGTGSAVFGVYDSFEYATVACTMLKDRFPRVFLTKNV